MKQPRFFQAGILFTLLFAFLLGIDYTSGAQVSVYFQISSLAWSPNGLYLAVGGGQSPSQCDLVDLNLHAIRIIDIYNNQTVNQLVGHTCEVISISWSPNGTKIATGSGDGTIRVWSTTTWQLMQTIPMRTFGGKTYLRWHPDNVRIIAVDTATRGVEIWDTQTGLRLNPEYFLQEGVSSADWNPDGSKVVTVTATDNISLWNTQSGQLIFAINGQHSGPINSVEWSPDGAKIASIGEDKTAKIWNSITGTLLKTLQHPSIPVLLSWSSSGNLATADLNDTLRIWDVNSGQILKTIDYSGQLYAIEWSPDSQQIAIGGIPESPQNILAPLIFPSSNPPSGTGGTGLFGQFFDNADLTGFKLNRIDPTVNFTWGSGSPAPSIDANTFSARWTGQIIPQFSETYTFYTQSDDGVRLWVNDTLLINNWTDHSSTEDSATIALTANFRYNIKLEYYDNTFSSTIKLSWSSPSQPKQVVPQDRLFPNGKIVFQSNTTGDNEIFIMNPDGTGVQNRTNNSASDTYPSVVPGGTQIVFVSNRDGNGEIYSMPINGGTATNLTNHSATDNYPSLYQDGRIVFSSARNGGNFNLWLRDAAGTVTQLTNTTGTERHSAWSPDGQWIVYDMEEGGVTHLYKIPASGGTPVQLTTTASNFEPDWSLDGIKITFRSNRSGSSQVYVMDANGSNQAPFIATPPSGFNPTWGMDSGRVTFHSWKDSSQPEIYTLASGASAAVRLTNNSILDQYPVWGAQ